MLRRLTLLAAGLGAAGASAWVLAVRPAYRHWGVDPGEAARALPGDDLVAAPDVVETRGVTIEAAPADVWPWLVQMGYGRGGWYGFEGMDPVHPAAREIRPELQALAVGDVMPVRPGGGLSVRVLEPARSLVLYADEETVGGASGGGFTLSWAFALEAAPDGGTRLIERVRLATTAQRPVVQGLSGPLRFGIFVMLRRHLLGFRERVEAPAAIHVPLQAPGASPA